MLYPKNIELSYVLFCNTYLLYDLFYKAFTTLVLLRILLTLMEFNDMAIANTYWGKRKKEKKKTPIEEELKKKIVLT